MTVSSLDNEFLQYWSALTVVQKESVLSVIKSFVQPQINNEQYNLEINKAVERVLAGAFYTQEEAEKVLLNGNEE